MSSMSTWTNNRDGATRYESGVRYSDVIIAMKDGRIISEGQPNDVLTEEMVRHIYHVSVTIKQDAETGMYIVPVGI